MNSTIAVAGRTLVALILRFLSMLDERAIPDVKIRWLLGEGHETFDQIFNDAVSTLEKGWIDYIQKKFKEIIQPGVSFEADRQPSDDIIQTLSFQHPTVSHLLVGQQDNFDPGRFPLSFVLGRLLKPVTPDDLKQGKFHLTKKEFIRFLLQMGDTSLANELWQLYPDGFWIMLRVNKTQIALKICVVDGVVSIKDPGARDVLSDGRIAGNQAILLPYRG
jgi:hypothetical protein